ncbi:LysR substrate-binding domain-containing protein [Rummeliibacillus sp. NPDC094406]|uniref:LysR substrate-binding domain-containing protein n=1 Tax=Rummeliibacillus sp. NPDC094406 TaxID=3364511 RepID=UPI00380CE1C7
MADKLQIFLTVVKHMNFSRAAEELYMTQPAVSQYIKSLEEELNVQLFDRSQKKIQLTKAGEIVVYYGKEINMLSTKMNRALDDLTNHVAGELLLGASYSYGEYLLPKCLAAFLTDYPQVYPRICIDNTTEIADKIINQTLDLGIIEGSIPIKRIVMHKIATDHMVIVAKSEQTVHNLNDQTWIIREQGSGTREAFEHFIKEHNIVPHSILEFGSTQLIKEAVVNGLGVALLSEWTIENEMQLNKLQIVLKDKYNYNRDFHAIHLNTPFLSKTTETFLEFLKK